MRIVAKIIQGAIELALVALFGPFVLAYAGITKLMGWVELHAEHGGDKDAQDRARWRNS